MKKYFNSKKGASLVGNGLLIGLIAAVAIGSVVSLGSKSSNVFETIVCNMNSALLDSEEDCSLIGANEEEVENLPPEITTIELDDAYYLVPYSATLAATDPDSGSLSWSSSEMIDGLALDSSGNLTGSPIISGIRNMNVSLSDDSGNSDDALLDLKIIKDKLVDVSFNDSDEVGFSIAISGNYVALGSQSSDDLGINSGAVYIFDISSGELLRKIIHESDEPGSEDSDKFGYSLAINGTQLIIGARKSEVNGINTGIVYMYDITTGAKIRKFVSPDGDASDNFGYSVAINENYVVVGATGDDDDVTFSGSVYVFNVNTGSLVRKLTASNPVFGDSLGGDVSVDGDYVVASAQGADEGGTNSGVVYIFNISTGDQIAKLVPSDATGYDSFEKVYISGSKIVIGARGHSADGINNSGAIYYYSFNGTFLNFIGKITADDSKEDLNLGSSVQISSGYLFAGSSEGAYMFDISATNQLEFNENSNLQLGKFTKTIDNGTSSDKFGYNVSVSGTNILISDSRDSSSGSYAGAAYIIKSDGEQKTWISNAVH